MTTTSKNTKSIKRSLINNYKEEKSTGRNQGKLLIFPSTEDAQSQPLSFVLGSDTLAYFKIDRAYLRNRKILKIEGWSIGNLSFGLKLNGNSIDNKLTRSSRPDVVINRGISENKEGHGWAMVSEPFIETGDRHWTFVVTINDEKNNSTLEFPITVNTDTEKSKTVLALGNLEGVVTSSIAGLAIVTGWAILPKGFSLWFEQDKEYYPLLDEYCIHFNRQDVIDCHQSTHGIATLNSGFVARIPELQTELPLSLVAKRDDEFSVLCTTQVASLPSNPESAARWLFGVQTPQQLISSRFSIIDMPLLDSLISQHKKV
jgi:hypothetical protein